MSRLALVLLIVVAWLEGSFREPLSYRQQLRLSIEPDQSVLEPSYERLDRKRSKGTIRYQLGPLIDPDG